MKITEVISELVTILKEHGDLRVTVYYEHLIEEYQDAELMTYPDLGQVVIG